MQQCNNYHDEIDDIELDSHAAPKMPTCKLLGENKDFVGTGG